MLTFEESTHQYKFNGVNVPSVTQILSGSGLIDLSFINKDLLAEKADLGTKVHQATELYDQNEIDLDELHPTLKSYLDSWIKFRKESGFEPTGIEIPLYHSVYKFAGRIDRVGTIGKDLIILDIKSGTSQKSHAIQTAAYQMLFNRSEERRVGKEC